MCCRMLDEDGSIIYGLDEQARCMRGYTDGVQETAQFIVGTQTLKRDNMVGEKRVGRRTKIAAGGN